MNVCTHENYKVFVDSLSSSTWINSQNKFVTHFVNPIKNVSEVKLISCSFDISTASNVCYIKCDELESPFNISGVNSEIAFDPVTKTSTVNSLACIPVTTGRTVYKEQDFNTTTKFINPIRRLDRLTISLLDETGSLATVQSNTFATFEFQCNRENLC